MYCIQAVTFLSQKAGVEINQSPNSRESSHHDLNEASLCTQCLFLGTNHNFIIPNYSLVSHGADITFVLGRVSFNNPGIKDSLWERSQLFSDADVTFEAHCSCLYFTHVTALQLQQTEATHSCILDIWNGNKHNKKDPITMNSESIL
jgi:hypothetical protein